MNAIHWLSGNSFVAAQTLQIEKEFKTSRPQPRNKAMGFKGNDKKKRVRRSIDPILWKKAQDLGLVP